jgi:glyoxylase-like metal-dependent hydrolase (beta-lactamase superfamily II)
MSRLPVIFMAYVLFLLPVRAEFREVGQDVFVWTDTCNAYVIRSGDAAIMIDLGDGSALDHLEEIGVNHLEWVLFTGHQRELLQGVARLNREETGVAAPKEEQALFETPLEFRKWHPRLRDKFSVHGSSYVRPPRVPVVVDRWLADGEVFEWRGLRLRCLNTPGHSPGGMSFVWDSDAGVQLFLGGVMHDGGKLTNWFDTEWDYGFGEGLDALIATTERLSALNPAVAFSSDGPVVWDAASQLKSFREKLVAFRPDYVRGYPLLKPEERQPHPATTPTKVPYVVEVSPHLYMFGKEMAGKNFAIIIADSGHALLLDCGLFPKLVLDRIIREMKQHLGLKQIDACWISHSHGDHFTLFPALQEHGVEFWTMDTIVDKCENPRFYDYPAMIGAYNAGFEEAKIDRILKAGDVIEWEGYRLQVDWMPGQTEFGNALSVEIDGRMVVFSGDNLFGDPSDPLQNGHECVVARNSAIIEEGYLVAAEYLQRVKPDIIVGAHTVLMTEPAAFIDRYHDWAVRIIQRYKDLLPDEDYEYLFDPYWVSAYPYRVNLAEADEATVEITVRNFRDRPQRHRVMFQPPPGLKVEPAELVGEIGPKSRQSFIVKLIPDPDKLPTGVQMVPMDITLDGKRYGRLFDFLVKREP